MKKFKIYFSIFGKKMVTEIIADTENEAKRELMDKIIFHKIEAEILSREDEKMLEYLKRLFNM
jgi:hypothetical protein